MDEKTLPTHPFTGLTAIGFTSRGPVWPVAGGSQPVGGGDEDDEQDDDAAEEAEDGDSAEEAEEPEVDWQAKVTELQAQNEALQANLSRARNQAKKLRQEREAAKPPAAPVKAAPAKATNGRQQPEPQVVTVQDDAEIERMQTVALRAYAKAALLGAGCDPELIDAPLSKLRAADIDWPEDEDEPFLDEWVDEMKAKYGKAFAPPAPPAASAAAVRTRRAGSIDQAAGNGSGGGVRTAEKEVSFGERLWQSGGGDVRAPRRPRR